MAKKSKEKRKPGEKNEEQPGLERSYRYKIGIIRRLMRKLKTAEERVLCANWLNFFGSCANKDHKARDALLDIMIRQLRQLGRLSQPFTTHVYCRTDLTQLLDEENQRLRQRLRRSMKPKVIISKSSIRGQRLSPFIWRERVKHLSDLEEQYRREEQKRWLQECLIPSQPIQDIGVQVELPVPAPRVEEEEVFKRARKRSKVREPRERSRERQRDLSLNLGTAAERRQLDLQQMAEARRLQEQRLQEQRNHEHNLLTRRRESQSPRNLNRRYRGPRAPFQRQRQMESTGRRVNDKPPWANKRSEVVEEAWKPVMRQIGQTVAPCARCQGIEQQNFLRAENVKEKLMAYEQLKRYHNHMAQVERERLNKERDQQNKERERQIKERERLNKQRLERKRAAQKAKKRRTSGGEIIKGREREDRNEIRKQEEFEKNEEALEESAQIQMKELQRNTPNQILQETELVVELEQKQKEDIQRKTQRQREEERIKKEMIEAEERKEEFKEKEDSEEMEDEGSDEKEEQDLQKKYQKHCEKKRMQKELKHKEKPREELEGTQKTRMQGKSQRQLEIEREMEEMEKMEEEEAQEERRQEELQRQCQKQFEKERNEKRNKKEFEDKEKVRKELEERYKKDQQRELEREREENRKQKELEEKEKARKELEQKKREEMEKEAEYEAEYVEGEHEELERREDLQREFQLQIKREREEMEAQIKREKERMEEKLKRGREEMEVQLKRGREEMEVKLERERMVEKQIMDDYRLDYFTRKQKELLHKWVYLQDMYEMPTGQLSLAAESNWIKKEIKAKRKFLKEATEHTKRIIVELAKMRSQNSLLMENYEEKHDFTNMREPPGDLKSQQLKTGMDLRRAHEIFITKAVEVCQKRKPQSQALQKFQERKPQSQALQKFQERKPQSQALQKFQQRKPQSQALQKFQDRKEILPKQISFRSQELEMQKHFANQKVLFAQNEEMFNRCWQKTQENWLRADFIRGQCMKELRDIQDTMQMITDEEEKLQSAALQLNNRFDNWDLPGDRRLQAGSSSYQFPPLSAECLQWDTYRFCAEVNGGLVPQRRASPLHVIYTSEPWTASGSAHVEEPLPVPAPRRYPNRVTFCIETGRKRFSSTRTRGARRRPEGQLQRLTFAQILRGQDPPTYSPRILAATNRMLERKLAFAKATALNQQIRRTLMREASKLIEGWENEPSSRPPRYIFRTLIDPLLQDMEEVSPEFLEEITNADNQLAAYFGTEEEGEGARQQLDDEPNPNHELPLVSEILHEFYDLDPELDEILERIDQKYREWQDQQRDFP